MPPGSSWADAEAKAKEAGIVLSKAHYYVIKSGLKKAAGGGPRKAKPGRQGKASGGGLHLASNDKDENAIIAAVRKLGAARARAIIDAAAQFGG